MWLFLHVVNWSDNLITKIWCSSSYEPEQSTDKTPHWSVNYHSYDVNPMGWIFLGPGLLSKIHFKIHVNQQGFFFIWPLIGWRLCCQPVRSHFENLCQLTWILTWKLLCNPCPCWHGLKAPEILNCVIFPIMNCWLCTILELSNVLLTNISKPIVRY